MIIISYTCMLSRYVELTEMMVMVVVVMEGLWLKSKAFLTFMTKLSLCLCYRHEVFSSHSLLFSSHSREWFVYWWVDWLIDRLIGLWESFLWRFIHAPLWLSLKIRKWHLCFWGQHLHPINRLISQPIHQSMNHSNHLPENAVVCLVL